MKNISKILLYGFTILVLLSNLNNLFSQLRNQWIVVDSNGYNITIRDGANSINYADNNHIIGIFVKDYYNKFLRVTNNGGNNWESILTDTILPERWQSVSSPSKENIIITGQKEEVIFKGQYQDYYKEYGLIIISNDSGKTWSKTYLDSNSRLWYLSMLDTQYGVAYKLVLGNYFNKNNYNNNDSLLITENGWNTWKSVLIPLEIKYALQLTCISKNVFLLLIVYYDDNKSYIYTTEDGGLNWTISKVIPNRIQKMKFIDKNTGWAIGIMDTIYRTIDGGQSWLIQRYIEPGLPFGLTDIDFTDKDNGIVVGANGLILYTSDGGETWQREYKPSNMGNSTTIARIIFPSLDAAYACLSNDYIIKRTNNKILKAPTIKRKIFASSVPITGNILEWDRIDGATHYELVYFKKNRDSTSVFATFEYVKNIVVTDTNLELDTLEYNTEYQLKIRAFNESISSEWNQDSKTLLTIKNENSLSCPIILYPEPYSDFRYPTSMTARWSSREYVDGYDLILYEMSIVNYIIKKRESSLKDTSYYLDSLTPNKGYLLNLRSIRNDTTSEWAMSIFYTGPATDVVETLKRKKENIIKQIIPNPVSDRCIIKFSDNSFNISGLKLYNSMGVEIADLTGDVQFLYGKKGLELNLSSLSSGVYFVVVQTQHHIYSKSFVVIR